MKLTSLLLTILFGLISLIDLSAQSLSIKPGLVRMENENLTVGVDFEAAYQKEYTITSETGFPRLVQFDLNANGTLLPKPELNPNHQYIDLFFGYLISFKKAQELQLGQEPEPSKDYGSLGLGITTNFEANQTFTEQLTEQGMQLRYINSSNQFLPVLEASYLFARPIRSEIHEDLRVPEDSYRRFEARAFWVIRLKQFLLNPDFRYFKSVDLSTELGDAGLDEGLHSSISLGYIFIDKDTGPLQFFEYLYLQYNYGQFPVYLGNRETIEAGISFRF